MRDLFAAARLLLLDLASTVFFLVVFLLTKNIPLSVVLGVALGIGQIAFEFVRKRPIDTMQWLSLFLVVGAGTATLITNDPRFVMVKPSLIYLVVGVVMLKPGWMNRYLPPVAKELVPDVAFIFGFVWSGLMFFSAALNLIVALSFTRRDVGVVHVDLRHRQQARPVSYPVFHHAVHRHPPQAGHAEPSRDGLTASLQQRSHAARASQRGAE